MRSSVWSALMVKKVKSQPLKKIRELLIRRLILRLKPPNPLSPLIKKILRRLTNMMRMTSISKNSLGSSSKFKNSSLSTESMAPVGRGEEKSWSRMCPTTGLISSGRPSSRRTSLWPLATWQIFKVAKSLNLQILWEAITHLGTPIWPELKALLRLSFRRRELSFLIWLKTTLSSTPRNWICLWALLKTGRKCRLRHPKKIHDSNDSV